MLINLSNHPVSNWTNEQLKEAEKLFGSVVDLPFPNIPPHESSEQVGERAVEYLFKIKDMLNINSYEPNAVHVMGELTFCFKLIDLLKQNGIVCVASTTERIVEESEGKKTSIFKFVRFREY